MPATPIARAVEQAGLTAAHGISVHDTLGAVFIGLIVASVLYGITTLQTYLYFHHFPKDTRLHKISVALLWIQETIHLACLAHTSYHYGITGFGDLSMDGQVIVWSVKLSCLINVIIILMVHSLYAFRVWILGGYHKGFLGYFVAGVVAGGFIIGIVLVYMVYTTDKFSNLGSISWAIDSSLAASTTIDLIISVAMCYYLRKSKGQITKLNSRISALMQYILGSGVLTSACSLSILFTFTLMPNSLVFLAIQGLSTQLYVGSFLCMLNARTRSEQEGSTTAVSQPSFTTPRSGFSGKRNVPLPALNVNVHTTWRSSAPSTSVSETKQSWDDELGSFEGEPLKIPGSAYQLSPQNSPSPLLHKSSSLGSPRKPEYTRQW